MENELTILIADNSEVFRTGLKQIINNTPYLMNVKDADSNNGFTTLTDIFQPTILFLNSERNGSDSCGFVAVVASRYPATKIIALYETPEERFVQRLFQQNTHGIIHRDAPAAEFLTALEQVMHGDVFYCQHTLSLLSSQAIYAKRKAATLTDEATFTPREKQIISLICEECTAKEMADKLALSRRTIENMKTKIQEKMRAKNMAGIVGYAFRHNLLKRLF